MILLQVIGKVIGIAVSLVHQMPVLLLVAFGYNVWMRLVIVLKEGFVEGGDFYESGSHGNVQYQKLNVLIIFNAAQNLIAGDTLQPFIPKEVKQLYIKPGNSWKLQFIEKAVVPQ